MTPDGLPTPEKRQAMALARVSFGLFYFCAVVTLLCVGLVVFAGAPRSALLLACGAAVLNGLVYQRVSRRAESVDQDPDPRTES